MESHDYDEDIRAMALEGKGVTEIYEGVTLGDVRSAADNFQPVCYTVPGETLDAYRDHGSPEARLAQDVERAGWVLKRLPELGISIDKVAQQLEGEGVEKFNKPFDKLMESLAKTSPRQVSEVP